MRNNSDAATFNLEMVLDGKITGIIFLNVVVTASAPGDNDAFCTATASSEAGMPAPRYPANVRVLMDSYHYFNLFIPYENNNAIWQQVQRDGDSIVVSVILIQTSVIVEDIFIIISFTVDFLINAPL